MTNTNENVVWITGASSGIGKAMAFEWARLGYKVVLSARRKELLEEIAIEIKNVGGEALVVPVDIMDEKSIENAVQIIIDNWGRLDVAVANAGFGVFGSIDKLTAKDWERQLQGNVTGLALTVKYALPHLKQNKGSIGLVGSVGAYVPNPHVGAYGASKGGLNMLTKVMTIEWAKYNIQSNTVCPTVILTPMGEMVWGKPEKGDPMKAKIPLGRFGTTTEVADLILYLSSSASDLVTGQDILIDGGFTAQ